MLFYVYDCNLLKVWVVELCVVLFVLIKLYFVMKVNLLLVLVGFMVGLVDGIDVVFGGELKVVLDVGIDL